MVGITTQADIMVADITADVAAANYEVIRAFG